MISSTVKFELDSIDDPVLTEACVRFIQAAYMVDKAAGQSSSGDGGHASGKPGSRAPGHEKCRGAVRRLTRLALDAENVMVSTITHLAEKETRSDVVESMGGVDIRIPAAGPSVKRRSNGTIALDESAIGSKLNDAIRDGAR